MPRISQARRLVGVLGGMGPLATIDFISKVLALTPATRDQDHVPLIVHQVPQIPDRSSAILQGTDEPLHPMLEGLERLARAGADLAVIPCNSAHHWHSRLSSLQPLKILHIADAVREELENDFPAVANIALMATRGTLRSGIYAERLGQSFGPLLPLDEQTQVLIDRAIEAVKAGDRRNGAGAAQAAAHRLIEQGANVLILACTELPVALAGTSLHAHCIDSSLALARMCIREAALPPA